MLISSNFSVISVTLLGQAPREKHAASYVGFLLAAFDFGVRLARSVGIDVMVLGLIQAAVARL